jgi:hypothetical protein
LKMKCWVTPVHSVRYYPVQSIQNDRTGVK